MAKQGLLFHSFFASGIRERLDACFWLRVSGEVEAIMLTGLQASEGLTDAVGAASKWLPRLVSKADSQHT